METALANLSQLVDMQKKRSISHGPRFPLQQPVPPGGVTKMAMPPVGTVVSLLKHVKSKFESPTSRMEMEKTLPWMENKAREYANLRLCH